MYYMKMMKKSITKKMVLVSIAISITILLPSLYISEFENSDISEIAFVLALAYPVLDAIVLVPALIGMMMFYKGK